MPHALCVLPALPLCARLTRGLDRAVERIPRVQGLDLESPTFWSCNFGRDNYIFFETQFPQKLNEGKNTSPVGQGIRFPGLL